MMAKTTLVSKATSTKRLNVLMKVADQAPNDSALAILINVVSIDETPIEELTKLATDIVNQEGLPKWMLQAGRRIEVKITERGPGTDSECYQLYGDQDEPYA